MAHYIDSYGKILVKSNLSHELHAKVVAGGAHWVTVKEGPLEGRHLLVDGPRPAEGKKSHGRILAGKGIPPHVVEKITGATHAHHLKHEVVDDEGENKVEVHIGDWSGYDSIISARLPGKHARHLIVYKEDGKYKVSPPTLGDREPPVMHEANSLKDAQTWAATHLKNKVVSKGKS